MKLFRVRKKSLIEKLRERGITVLSVAYDGNEPSYILVEDNPNNKEALRTMSVDEYILEEKSIEEAKGIFVGPLVKRASRINRNRERNDENDK